MSSAGSKGSPRMSTSPRSSVTRPGWCGSPFSRACVLGVVAATLLSPFWIILAVVPPVILNFVVRGRARSVRNEFAEQLPENLDVLASALRAGHSLAGAMGVVADEAPEPSKREFSRVVTDEQLGIPLDEALEVTAKRMQNSDMDQVAILALVQREAGGNTAEVLDQVTKNIRARMDVRRLVKVLTAQGKFSSVVVALIPVGIFLFLVLVNPSHLDPLFHETLGPVRLGDGRPDARAGLLRHPQDRLDRALAMIHFVLIIGLFILVVAVTMLVARQRRRPAGRSNETLEQIGAYGFAGSLPIAGREASRGRASGRDSTTSAPRSAAGSPSTSAACAARTTARVSSRPACTRRRRSDSSARSSSSRSAAPSSGSGSRSSPASRPCSSSSESIGVAAAGWVLPMFIVNARAKKRRDLVERGLPDSIDLLVVTLEAGLSFPQSLRLAATKVREPLASEVRLTLQEQNMGLTLVEALENLLARIDTPGRADVLALDRPGRDDGRLDGPDHAQPRGRDAEASARLCRGARAEGAGEDPLPDPLPDHARALHRDPAAGDDEHSGSPRRLGPADVRRVPNLTLRREDGRVVAESVTVADSTMRRLRGLLGKRDLPVRQRRPAPPRLVDPHGVHAVPDRRRLPRP